MKSISYIRFATYGLLIGSALVANHADTFIPVHLVSFQDSMRLRAREDAAQSASRVPKQLDFRHTRMSGSQVMATARTAMQKAGANLRDYGEPRIDLSHDHGQLVWIVGFFQLGGAAGAFYDVAIDDQTGAVKIAAGL